MWGHMAVRVVTHQGRTLELGRRLDDGGEGVVYEVDGSALVAKLLLDPADPMDLDRRLATLVRRGRSPRNARLLAGEPRRAAWPVATVRALPSRAAAHEAAAGHAGTGTPIVRGFLMPDMRRWYRPFSPLLNAGVRREEFPGSTWVTSLAAAAGLARLVAEVHASGFVIGDLKPGNLWVDKIGNVGISDIDSFQFGDGPDFFPCLARTPDYTAPERIGSAVALPDPAADSFVLAVLIYQLLMEGMHPFFGMPGDGTRYISIDDNVQHGRCRLVRPESVRKASNSPPLSALPRRLNALFLRCFDDAGRLGQTARPTPGEWAAALDAEREAERLRACRVNARHVYTAERPWCPWCDAAQANRTG
jgi:DNA-binding helix-hairpin-helix protein with protein kinase domain